MLLRRFAYKEGVSAYRQTQESILDRMHAIYSSLALLLGLAVSSRASTVRHDHSFQPDHILRVTADIHSEACSERYSVLVNGSSPGPELRLREGEVSWFRVYNDMTDANTTIVGVQTATTLKNDMTHSAAALAWPYSIHCPILRWIPGREPMADSPGPLLRLRSQARARLCRKLLLPLSRRLSGHHSQGSSYCRLERAASLPL
jgi:hypothetical protein